MTEFAAALEAANVTTQFARRTAGSSSQGIVARLPWLMCAAAGGRPAQADLVGLAWAELYDAMRLMDGVQDNHADDAARDLALSTGLYLRACRRLAQELPTQASDTVYDDLLVVAQGQYQDVTVQQPSLQVAMMIAEAKTGRFLALGARLGALAAGASQDVVSTATEFGQAFGTLVQLLDDVEWLEAARTGLKKAERGSNLAIAFARERVPSDALGALERDLAQMISDSGAAQRAASALIKAGARVDLAQRCLALAKTAIAALDQLPGAPEDVDVLRRYVLDVLLTFRPSSSPPGSTPEEARSADNDPV